MMNTRGQKYTWLDIKKYLRLIDSNTSSILTRKAMDQQTELEVLYRNALALVDQCYRLLRLLLVKDPIAAADDWTRDNPNSAHRFGTQLYELVVSYFSRSSGR